MSAVTKAIVSAYHTTQVDMIMSVEYLNYFFLKLCLMNRVCCLYTNPIKLVKSFLSVVHSVCGNAGIMNNVKVN